MTLTKMEDKDFYVLKFEAEQYDVKTMWRIYNSLYNVFGDKLVCIPSNIDLFAQEKERLINYR